MEITSNTLILMAIFHTLILAMYAYHQDKKFAECKKEIQKLKDKEWKNE